MNKNEIVELIIKDEDIKEIIKSNNLSYEFVCANIYKFYDYYLDKNKCAKCTGLNNCIFEGKGYKDELILDGEYLELGKEKCDYLIKEEKKLNNLNNFVYCDIYSNMLDLNFKNITVEDDNKLLLTEIVNIIKGVKKDGFYLWGDYGVGKSYICSILANELTRRGKKVGYLRVNDFVNNLRDLRISDSSKYHNLLNNIKTADVIILDDIGAETVTEFSREDILFNILDYRMENKLMTIFISNLNKDKSEVNESSLYEHFLYDNKGNKSENNAGRLMERINNLAKETILLKGKNKRNM